jgi:hypothetical protein
MAPTKEDSFFIYYLSEDGRHYLYDRNAGSEQRANERLETLKKRGKLGAVWLKNHVIKGALY